MRKAIPTRIGDVLVLLTAKGVRTFAVGRVSNDGQQDFHGHANAKYVRDRAAALTVAKALVLPGRNIFFSNIDTGQWSKLAH